MDEQNRYYSNSIFWVEVDKIKPNPFQPRKEFDEARLKDLSDSIRQYGVLMPLVVTRQEFTKDDGGIGVIYELIAGERRLRASKMAGVATVPVVIRSSGDSDKEKLELAIIENLQREDLNPLDRAKAFQQLVEHFGLTHGEIGKKVGKSREYVSNTIRLLMLPQDMQEALQGGKISEGHTRPLLMLIDRPQEQQTLFREIMLKKMTVRESERIARKIAFERARKVENPPEITEIEEKLTERLGTRVSIERKQNGGKLVIDYFSVNDLENFLELVSKAAQNELRSGPVFEELPTNMVEYELGTKKEASEISAPVAPQEISAPPEEAELPSPTEQAELSTHTTDERGNPIDDSTKSDKEEDDLYSVSNFSI
ncbi:MAG: ParB/RepB/Spo0J family partition protein [Candidatus Vogelbacteria bacterium]|nr:ParB/RepB/Spo0J family partition protein [Candidatus Vogelbacteria bacterium]